MKDKLRRAIYNRDGGICQLCRVEVMYGGKNFFPDEYRRPAGQIDHIKPRIKGGTDDASNLRLLCFSCNAAKGGK